MLVSRLQIRYLIQALLLLCFSSPVNSATLHIATAANFRSTLEELAAAYQEQNQEVAIKVSTGATGTLYAQIQQGAPFDLFFAADQLRPNLLFETGGYTEQPFTYAYGRLVVWSHNRDTDPDLRSWIMDSVPGFEGLIAIANPDTAPYGEAARELLIRLGLFEHLTSRIVTGDNVAQAFQFAASGNAEICIVSLALVSDYLGGKNLLSDELNLWIPDSSLYSPIAQSAILLTDGDEGRSFWQFVQSETARQIIRESGYYVELEDPEQVIP